jgi:hypothetical protein
LAVLPPQFRISSDSSTLPQSMTAFANTIDRETKKFLNIGYTLLKQILPNFVVDLRDEKRL